jgi:hypothetical protein
VPFFNVGIWASHEAFKKEVIDRFVEGRPRQLPFEYAPRTRMILSPEQWRVGEAVLPGSDHLVACDGPGEAETCPPTRDRPMRGAGA